MTARFTTRCGMRVERLSRLPSPPRIVGRAGIPVRRAANWRALPVEGSKAWRDRLPLLSRIISR